MSDKVDDAFEMSPENLKWFLDTWSKVMADNPSTTPQDLTEIAASTDDRTRQCVARNPNCPPLVKMWIESDRYGGMTLKEFLEGSSEVLPWP